MGLYGVVFMGARNGFYGLCLWGKCGSINREQEVLCISRLFSNP